MSFIHATEIYRSLLNNMSEGFARCQMIYKKNEAVDFKYLEVNRAFEKLTGLKNVVDKKISEVLVNHKTENKELFELYERVVRTGEPEKIESYVAEIDIWFSISVYGSENNQFLVIFDNITKRKQAEEALQISKEQFKGLFIQSHVGTAIVGLDKRFIKCNESFCQFLGYSESEIIGKTIADFTHPDDKDIGMKDIKLIAEGKLKTALVQKRYIRKNGNIVWGELTISLVHNQENKPLYFLPVIRDLTRQMKADKELKENEARLKELNSTKDKLFSIIAHDLKSPFNSILGFSELLLKKENKMSKEKSIKCLEIIHSSAKNTLILLDNLLNWSKSQTGQITFNPKKNNLTSLIEQSLKILNPQAKIKNISIINLLTDDIEVFADTNMIQPILQNLISNAIKFTNSGGSINISAHSERNKVEISIADNGVGMSKEKCENLFKISTNTTTPGTENEEGSGLGLVICKEFVEKNGGNIWLESIEGKGSNFKFTLPKP